MISRPSSTSCEAPSISIALVRFDKPNTIRTRDWGKRATSAKNRIQAWLALPSTIGFRSTSFNRVDQRGIAESNFVEDVLKLKHDYESKKKAVIQELLKERTVIEKAFHENLKEIEDQLTELGYT